jgi:hypothetical protein
MTEPDDTDGLSTQDGPRETPIRQRALPHEIKQKRSISSSSNERLGELLQPRIDHHLEIYGVVLDAVDNAHDTIADESDLNLESDTREAAVWIASGRCIGYGRAVLALASAGFGGEAAAQMRAAHEAARLLSALADEGEPELLRRWLADADDNWVRPSETRDAQERNRARVRTGMETAKVEARAAGDAHRVVEIEAILRLEAMQEGDHLTLLTRHIYDVLSRIAHTRRSGTTDAVAIELSKMATGPHPDPVIRADYVKYAGHMIEEVVLSVGDALA